MINQEETKVDSLNLKKTQEDDREEKMSSEEWLDYLDRLQKITGATRSFKNAGKCFVIPYKKPKQ